MRPYYQDGAVTIYHGDCRDCSTIQPFDVLITDPPYGVNMGHSAEKRPDRIIAIEPYASYEDTYENLTGLMPAIWAFVSASKRAAIFTGPHFRDYPQSDALGGIYCPSAIGCHKWGFNVFLPVLFYGTDPNLQNGRTPSVFKSTARAEDIGHPCPKPIEWMCWLICKASKTKETILDPFMGSGTTLRAAKDLGRKAIGIEIEEKYCEVAAKRMSQEVLNFGGVQS